MSDTPETDAQTWAGHCGDGDWGKVVYAHWAQKLERERDAARMLCRWAFPRLRAMCHDFDVSNTGWACAKEMESHPEIFSSANAKSAATGSERKDHE